METQAAAVQTKPETTVSWRDFAKFAVLGVVLPIALLFGAAGRLDWPLGWAWVGMALALGIGGRVLAWRVHPGLMEERARFMRGEGVKGWDRILIPLAMLAQFALWLLAGLDHRFGWTALPLWAQIAGLVVAALGFGLGIWAMLANRYFSSVVRIQTERGHAVVRSGPYRYLRHPGYAGSLLGYAASAIALGSLWALIPVGLAAAVFVVRTTLEDRTLHAELPGYAEYARQTRYRLLPGVW